LEENSKVSILVAARNEEANIERCLQALSDLDFPAHRLEVLVGDDQSTDETARIIKTFIADKPHFRYFLIEQEVAGLKAKANVLAQLARHARGQYLLFCDADITVPNHWVTNLLQHFKPNTGIVVGVTRMRPEGIFADLQSLEWLFTMGGVRMLSLFKIPITGMGNNMAVTREAYQKVGGYEKIGFSIVEDFSLFMAIIKADFGFVQAFDKGVLARSEPLQSYQELMIQRKRWMVGAMKLPWLLKSVSFVTALFLPFLLVLAFWNPGLSAGIALFHYGHVTLGAAVTVAIIQQRDLWKAVPLFWFYTMINYTCMLVNYYLPNPTVWKGRKY
jgi:cellulose synthase/poly-beta-1,6-N-acetylglucosamine synthase-like glycosyltransferase